MGNPGSLDVRDTAKEGVPPAPSWTATLQLIGPLAVYRICLLLLIYLGLVLIPMGFFREKVVSVSNVTFLEACSTWDTGYYYLLSEFGYRPAAAECNYFPLWPALIHVLTRTGVSRALGAVVLTNVLSLAATLLLHRLALLRFGADTAEAAVLLLLAFPAAFFLAVPYSESLFLLLAVALFLAIHHDHSRWICMLGFLLVFARPVGFLCVVPIVVDQLLKGRRLGALAMASGPLIGLVGYFLLMKIYTGDALIYVHLQSQMLAKPSAAKLLHPLDFLSVYFTRDMQIHGYLNSLLDRCLLAIGVAALFPIARRSWVDLAYALPMTILPAVSASLISYSRYALVVFPLFMIGGQFLSARGRRPWLWVVLAFSFAIQIFLMIRHTHGYWAG